VTIKKTEAQGLAVPWSPEQLRDLIHTGRSGD